MSSLPNTFIEMRWRCATCDVEVLGRYPSCSGCGKAKEDEPYYDVNGSDPLTREEVLADAALRALAEGGPDWCCSYCGSEQPRHVARCLKCGAEQVRAADIDHAFHLAPVDPTSLPSSYLAKPPKFVIPPRAIKVAAWFGFVGAILWLYARFG